MISGGVDKVGVACYECLKMITSSSVFNFSHQQLSCGTGSSKQGGIESNDIYSDTINIDTNAKERTCENSIFF